MALSMTVSGICGTSLVESFEDAQRICEILNLHYVNLEENGGFTIYKDGGILEMSTPVKKYRNVEEYKQNKGLK